MAAANAGSVQATVASRMSGIKKQHGPRLCHVHVLARNSQKAAVVVLNSSACGHMVRLACHGFLVTNLCSGWVACPVLVAAAYVPSAYVPATSAS